MVRALPALAPEPAGAAHGARLSAAGALAAGLRAAARNWGLAAFLLALNLGLAAVLAVPLAGALEEGFAHRDAAQNMLTGFDYGWWTAWSERQTGAAADFGPEILGAGFVFRNLELLLGGQLPARLFAPAAAAGPRVDGVILAVGVLYLVVQTFLAGGLLGVLRTPSAGWTVRGLLHGSGFYAGRMFRLLALTLLVDGLVFALHAPFARFAVNRAREAVSENTALVWLFGHHALLLLALLAVHLLAGYAKAIVVVEERSSAVLAMLSALGFCGRNPGRTILHSAAVLLIGIALVAAWTGLDGLVPVSGYRTQLLWLVLAQGFVGLRLFLRVSLLGGQVALYRATA
ncbi:MAG: hypothetical protein ABW221_10070 [Vicinamibacteria bacterium]